tara:strand:- start:597 stop:806 length:210 start_codon:yes stop_codon:yes gene_type:complete
MTNKQLKQKGTMQKLKKTYGVVTPTNRLNYVLEICKTNAKIDWDNHFGIPPQEEFEEIVKIIEGYYDDN